MTNKQIDNRIEKLEALEAQIKALEKQADAVKDELKAELGDSEHLETAKHRVNWARVLTERLDSKALKAEHPKMYSQYVKTTESRRFSYSTK